MGDLLVHGFMLASSFEYKNGYKVRSTDYNAVMSGVRLNLTY